MYKIILAVVLVLVLGAVYFTIDVQEGIAPEISLIQVCPEHWYVNQMPSPAPEVSDLPKEYFIYEDARRELSEFDTTWISENCEIEPEYVF